MTQEVPKTDQPSDSKDSKQNDHLRFLRPQLIVSLLIFLLFFIFFIPDIFINVKAGEAAVHWQRFFGGTVTEKVYGEGLQMIFPWDEMYTYNVRIQEESIEVAALTKEGLSVDLTVSLRYHPDYLLLGKLHKYVGPEYKDIIVVPEVISVLRTTIGKLSAEELYTTRYDVITKVVNDALEEVTSNYILVDDVIIKSVVLPEHVANSIDDKVRQKHIADSYVYRISAAQQEAERKHVEAKGYAAYNTTIGESLNAEVLQWEGVKATKELATSENTKVIVIGNDGSELPVILGNNN